MKNYFLAVLFVLIAVAPACKKPIKELVEEVRSDAVTGKVTDSQGNPLANIEVTVENQLTGNHNTKTVLTNQSGLYKIDLNSVGIYQASAYIKKSYNGIEYHIALHPDNTASFSREGAIRNFVWKLSGEMPDNLGFYGRSIEISPDVNQVEIEDLQNVEFTLTPIGPIIDGSNGALVKIHPVRVSSYYVIQDIPIGRYAATAIYMQGSVKKILLLKNRDSANPYSSNAIINFPGNISDPIAALSYKLQ